MNTQWADEATRFQDVLQRERKGEVKAAEVLTKNEYRDVNGESFVYTSFPRKVQKFLKLEDSAQTVLGKSRQKEWTAGWCNERREG